MNPRLYGIGLLLAVFCGRHVTVLPGVTVAAWIPALAVLAVTVAGLGLVAARMVCGFRSAPYPRIVPHWSAAL